MRAVKERTLVVGQSVEVYFNLHQKVFSIRDKKTKLVVAHTPQVTLHNVTFKVSQKGREKTVAQKQKNVHAFVVGEFISADEIDFPLGETNSAYYNPYTTETFVDFESKKPITHANVAYCSKKRVFYT